jgi:hypothetical protein
VTADLTPPPTVTWVVVVDSPELPRKVELEVSAMVEVEAQVRAAEGALLTIDAADLSAKFRRRKRENQVADVAKYAVATKK